MRILLLNDNTEHLNWGAQATPFALRHVLTERIPECEIKALTWSWIRLQPRVPRMSSLERFEFNRSPVPHLGFLFARLTRLKEIYPTVVDDFDWFAEQWAEGRMGPITNQFLDLVRWSDVVVYNGENSLYRNTLEGCRAIFLLHLVRTRLGKPACSLNHTVHITEVRPIMNAMVENVLPRLDLVTSREPRSHRNLLELGIANARAGADVVFALPETDFARRAVDRWLGDTGLSGRPFACLSGSGLPSSRPRGDYDGAITELVRRVQRTLGMPVVLLAKDRSCRFLEEVARRTGNPYFGPEHHFAELWPLLREASVLISGHYHYVIIAAISGCPFVPLTANNHKMAGVCEQLGWNRTKPFDITQLRPVINDISAEAAGLVRDRPRLSERLIRRAGELGELAMSTGDWVRGAVKKCQSENSGTRGWV